MSDPTEELAKQIARLGDVVDELARASLAQAGAANMQSQVMRELCRDMAHLKDRVEFVAENIKPRRQRKFKVAGT